MNARCQHFGPASPAGGHCGGCKSQDIPYEEQLKKKTEVVRYLFGESPDILPSPQSFHYRNRMDFAFGPNYSLGLKASKYEVVNVEKCWLMPEETTTILNRLRAFMRSKELKGYIFGAEDRVRGPMRHVIVRVGVNIKNTVLNVITSDKVIFPLEELWADMQDLVQGITWSINLSPADRSYGEVQKVCGQDHYLESLAGLKFKVPVQSFFQTNTLGGEKLIKIVQEFAEVQKHETVLDLYSGTGSIGLSLAKQVRLVIGIEENEPAVELSRTNAQLNGIENYMAMAGRAENVIQSLEGKFQTIIVDPPRVGLHKKVVAKIGEIAPKKIVYVSCNPTSQKQDIDILAGFGYRIEKIQPLDMFPHTPHIENIILLTN
ncbi:MAG: 23S rRNA (uracil(1939)-C(5))-methyltransferase RlmD [bacterium]